MNRRLSSALQQGILVLAGVLPAAWLLYGMATDRLGANPIEALTHGTGDWALRWLLASLAVTPLRQWLGWRWLAPHRRTLGLLSFAYAVLHLGVYAVIDQELDLAYVWEDVAERPYVTVGMAAFLCLLPLAVTSTRGWIRRLGRRWVLLHRLAYVAAVCAVLHFAWLVKADLARPLRYGALLAVLLAARLAHRLRVRFRTASPARAA